MRIFDIKDEKCQKIANDAPQIIDSLCEKCRYDFEKLLEFLDFLDIPYIFNPFLVRGLDYYSGAVYEILPQSKKYETKEALGGGGRYDYLIQTLGGKEMAATGVAFGIERLIAYIKEKEIHFDKKEHEKIFLAHLGSFGQKRALKLMEELRKENFLIYEAFSKESISAQKKVAEKLKVRFMVIVSQKEALENCVILRDRIAGTQEIISVKELPKKIRTIMRKTPMLRIQKKK